MDDWLKLQGYLIVYDKPAYFGGRKEVVEKGAATKLLERVARGEQEIFAVVDHNMDRLLARTGNRSLILSEDEKGVLATIRMRNTPENMRLYTNVRDGLYTGGSFRFLRRGTVEEDRAGIRVFRELNIAEVTVTGLPVYRETTLTTRSGDEEPAETRDGYEHWKIVGDMQVDNTQPGNSGSQVYYCSQ